MDTMNEKIGPVGVERLRELYAMLVGVPDRALNLRHWFGEGNGRALSVTPNSMMRTAKKYAEAHSCGTTACAVGWACTYPPFRAQGLRIEAGMSASRPLYTGVPGFTHSGWDAVQVFFELSEDQAKALFMERLIGWQFPSGHRAHSLRDREEGLTDRQKALRRIRRLLLRQRAITAARNIELAAQEGVPA